MYVLHSFDKALKNIYKMNVLRTANQQVNTYKQLLLVCSNGSYKRRCNTVKVISVNVLIVCATMTVGNLRQRSQKFISTTTYSLYVKQWW